MGQNQNGYIRARGYLTAQLIVIILLFFPQFHKAGSNNYPPPVFKARKHLKAALKSGGAIIAKVGIGTGAGLLGGLAAGGSKKDKLIGAGIGAAAGLLASTNDIKELKKQLSLRKECLRVIAQYQKDFTEEGIPVDANADLSAYQDCETVTKSAAQVAQELLASQEEGGSLEDYSDEELEKLLSEKEEA